MLTEESNSLALESALRGALEANPFDAQAHHELGNFLRSRGRMVEAESSLRQAFKLAPRSEDALVSLINVITADGRLDEAVSVLQRALAEHGDDYRAYMLLGGLLGFLERIDEAQVAFGRALRIKPESVEAHLGLSDVLLAVGAVEEGVQMLRLAKTLAPYDAAVHQSLIVALCLCAEDPGIILKECLAFASLHEAPLITHAVPHRNEHSPGRRLRLGYVSPDFRGHALAQFLMPVLVHRDRAAFEVVCYSVVTTPDETTRQMMKLVDVWRDVRHLPDAQLADMIREDEIDILIDLNLHLKGSRLLAFACRPAPIQMQWLGYMGTTGLQSIQYRLTDPFLDLPDATCTLDCYSETLVRLPQTFACFDPRLGLGKTIPTIGPLPARKNGYITFGCLATPRKLTDHTLTLWARVLAAIPSARLILFAPTGWREPLKRRIALHGIDVSRIEFVERQARSAYLSTYNRIDIGLETYPYHGYTTSLDAAWMGVPTPTRVGGGTCSRAGRSILGNLGLGELIAQDDTQYVQIVTRLAGDLERLANLRANLRRTVERSPLVDGVRFTRHLENALRELWRKWCASQVAC
ncbi:tetratricopeptide repeat protein [Paraburkholderia unamae]|uniref:protein O-GlcNAc transferase n=1 Tax=Paraburkholderia unamae TaxID=219649 RepID=A0ABX5KHB6_9BURK|nr:glycosyltransferase family 41 protein [Paraburkholderia unamae]PVX73228.1 putative O-linked N-acetylglucosamine transferase (SPINDLY family) [Paraburkholderia unamae]